MATIEDQAAQLTRELQSCDDVESVLERIRASIAWTPGLAESQAGRALFAAISSLPGSSAQESTKAVYYDQLRESELKETMERWWSYPPVASDAGRVIELSFIDETPGDEHWDAERVPCTAHEPFALAAQRFRVQANKKHRHPWLPSLYYVVILDDGDKRVTFESVAPRTVGEVLEDLDDGSTVRYERDDGGRAQRGLSDKSPARLLAPWDRGRILPAWCTMPDSWLEPTPPPGFKAPIVRDAQFYIAVPTLHVPGIGIVPTATKPQIITRTLYWPVRYIGPHVHNFLLDREKDLVPASRRLVASALTVENARALLGRYIQSSTEPLRDDEPPSTKKRKKDAHVNKYASQTVAIAWGLSLDDNGQPDWLHCITPSSTWQSNFAFDLKGLRPARRRYTGRPGVIHAECAWLGPIEFDADKRALQSEGEGVEQASEPDAGETLKEWTQRTERWIKLLNTAGIDKLVEVGADGTFVAGDIELSKADTDDWETYITGAKPGLWRMSVAESGAVHFAWVREGSLDYDALPRFSGSVDTDEGGAWEEVGSFSVDSGSVGMFSQSALEALIGEGDKQDCLETLIDAKSLDELGEYMPAGVVVSGDDGGHIVEGIKDATGKIVKLRMQSG